MRRALPRWIQMGVLLLVFVAGGIVGAMVATKALHARLEYYRQNGDALVKDIVPRLRTRLTLTGEQSSQFEEIMERRHPRMLDVRRKGADEMLAEFQAMEDEVAEVLDPKQRESWRKIAESVRNRFIAVSP
ncbi:MAG: hypothetical protein IT423_00450 [Pirellulaceae bacterium]|nr:hypothetical protein [Pirellulaceae bacterium]